MEERCGFILEKIPINEIIKGYHDLNAIIQGISDDSRIVQNEWIFIQTDKNKPYVQEAIRKGAIVLKYDYKKMIDLFEILEPKLCSFFKIIGVTGTNGKSSVAKLLSEVLKQNGHKVMMIGTGVIDYNGERQTITNTTPDVFTLWNAFVKAKAEKINVVVMEVSSHAIAQDRISFLKYDSIIYTNITQDHLDYHKTKVQYQYTKYKLRKYLKKDGIIIINNDFLYSEELYALSYQKIITIGKYGAHYTIENIELGMNTSRFKCHSFMFETNLLTMANVYNCVQVIAAARLFGISYFKLQSFFKNQNRVKGRMEIIYDNEITIMIDYAHTFEALRQLLSFLKKQQRRIILVIGCGGEREIEKRYFIGKLAASMCDLCIFTSDNPRFESIQKILLDMKKEAKEEIVYIENRKFAIKHAITHAKKSDIIIIAGKGNEQTQTILGNVYSFNDAQIVLAMLNEEEVEWK